MKKEPDTPMQGRLPVRVLMNGMLARYENIAPGLLEEVLDEIKYRDFRPEVICATARNPICTPCVLREMPVVGSEKTVWVIEIEESFLQFIWCIAFSISIMYLELYEKPLLRGQLPKTVNKEDPIMQQALAVSEAGVQLLKSMNPQVFYSLPNPEFPLKDYEEYIEVANQLFFVAGSFILLHEVGHQFLGHTTMAPSLESKDEEHQADRYAVSWVKQGMGHHRINDTLLSTGTMVAMLAILLLHKDLDGGPAHPHPDERMIQVLEHLSLSENHPMWTFGVLGLPMWIATHGKVELNVKSWNSSPKDLFILTIQQLVESRRKC